MIPLKVKPPHSLSAHRLQHSSICNGVLDWSCFGCPIVSLLGKTDAVKFSATRFLNTNVTPIDVVSPILRRLAEYLKEFYNCLSGYASFQFVSTNVPPCVLTAVVASPRKQHRRNSAASGALHPTSVKPRQNARIVGNLDSHVLPQRLTRLVTDETFQNYLDGPDPFLQGSISLDLSTDNFIFSHANKYWSITCRIFQ